MWHEGEGKAIHQIYRFFKTIGTFRPQNHGTWAGEMVGE
jgi:hypothetical protein